MFVDSCGAGTEAKGFFVALHLWYDVAESTVVALWVCLAGRPVARSVLWQVAVSGSPVQGAPQVVPQSPAALVTT